MGYDGDERSCQCESCISASLILQEWIDKQGHDRCWYYPELFHQLCEVYVIKSEKQPALPSLEEFKAGCELYQLEQFGRKST